MSDAQEKQFRLRIPEGLYADIEVWSEEEVRSVNGQIVKILQEAVRKWKTQRAQRGNDIPEDIEMPELVAA